MKILIPKLLYLELEYERRKQFYYSERSDTYVYDSRARVDRFLAKYLKDKFKNRLFSLDEDLVKNAKIHKWDGKVLKIYNYLC